MKVACVEHDLSPRVGEVTFRFFFFVEWTDGGSDVSSLQVIGSAWYVVISIFE